MSQKLKMVVVGDELLPPESIINSLESELDKNWELTSCWFGPRDLGELDKELGKLEQHGANAVPHPESLESEVADADILRSEERRVGKDSRLRCSRLN